MTLMFAPAVMPRLPRSTPEAQGLNSSAVHSFLDTVVRDGQEMHSVMILRRGAVITEGWWSPYAPEHPHMLYSLSKSFTATAAGLAVAEGKFSLEDTVVSFFPDDVPTEISANLAAMRVRDLLTMSSGHNEEPPIRHNPTENWARAFLAHPVTHEPGTHFVYSSSATYMVSVIVQKTTGQDLLEYLGPRLFAPLGMGSPTWERCPRGIPVGGWGLNVRTEDIAVFGELYRNGGVWNGERILPEGWVATATEKHVSNGSDPNNDWNQGYGFQFWRCRHGAYRGDGAFGQYCVVLPEQEAVVAITSRVNDMGAVLNGIWDVLLPAMGAAPLAEDSTAHTALSERLSHLSIPPQDGERSAETAVKVSGTTYRFAPNEMEIASAVLNFAGNGGGGKLALSDGERDYEIPFGYGEWANGATGFPAFGPAFQSLSASGAWTDDDTFTLKICFYETPFIPTITCRFADDMVTMEIYGSMGFGPKERPALIGSRDADK
ncbi:MAG: serine hydrolase [Fibrella sp.]|nr:serine hydrolase [Armatimonadota bacterium]